MIPQFNINCPEFVSALSTVGSVATGRAANPAIKNRVLLRAYDDRITLIATNGGLEVWAQIPADIKQEGGVIIEYAPVAGIFDKVEGNLSVKEKDGRIEFKSGRAKIVMAWMKQDEFPEAAQAEGVSISIPFDEWEAIVKQAGFAFAKVEGYPIFEGVHIYARNGIGYAESTDKFHLTQKTFNPQGKGFDALIDGVSLRIAMSKMQNARGDIEIRFGRSHLFLFRGGWGASVPLIEGKYPDIVDFMSRKSTARFTALRSDFLDALRRVRVTAVDGNVMRLQTSRNKVTLSSVGGESDAVVEVEAKIKGAEYEVYLSDDFLFRVLSAYPHDEFTFENEDKVSPIFVRAEGLSYAVVPINRK